MRDPRADSREKIPAPPPLPHVSRRALRRVTGYMPPPTVCHYCHGYVRLVRNAEVYGRSYGEWPYLYRCEDCEAHVGLHPDTDLPLGTLADKSTAEARKCGKSKFFTLQHREGWDRRQAYAWLAERLGIPVEECHWGFFDEEIADRAGALCQEEL